MQQAARETPSAPRTRARPPLFAATGRYLWQLLCDLLAPDLRDPDPSVVDPATHTVSLEITDQIPREAGICMNVADENVAHAIFPDN